MEVFWFFVFIAMVAIMGTLIAVVGMALLYVAGAIVLLVAAGLLLAGLFHAAGWWVMLLPVACTVAGLLPVLVRHAGAAMHRRAERRFTP